MSLSQSFNRLSQSKFFRFRNAKWIPVLAIILIILQLFVFILRLCFEDEMLPSALEGLNALALGLSILLFLYTLSFRRPLELWVLLLYTGWISLSRFLLGGYMESMINTMYGIAAAWLFLGAGSLMQRSSRRHLLDALTVFFAAISLFFSILGLSLILSGGEAYTLWGVNWVSVADVGYKDLCFLDCSHNVSAIWLMIAFVLLLYQWFARKHKIWRFFIVPAEIILFLTMGVQHCRTAIFCTMTAMVLFLVLWVGQFLSEKQSRHRILGQFIALPLAAVLVFGIYVGMTKSADWLAHIQAVQPASSVSEEDITVSEDENHSVSETAPGDETVSDQPVPESTPQKQTAVVKLSEAVAEERELSESLSTFSSRVPIWKAIIPTIQENPTILWLGQIESVLMDDIVPHVGGEYVHMHNMFLQTLALSGVAGLALLLVFIISLLVKMIRAFFRPVKGEWFADKVMIAMLAALLLSGITEPLLMSTAVYQSPCFLIANLTTYAVAGIFLANDAEDRAAFLEGKAAVAH